jgi:DNA adenine methylase
MLPFLRWAGGKRKLAELISNCISVSFWNSSNKFYEPFVGGGAVMLHLGDIESTKFVEGSRLNINDMNPDLICTYQVIQRDVEALILKLKILSKDLSKEKYYEIRAQQDLEGVERAARFIYLNKTGFNGLWRVNGKGHYNVPWGQLKNPKIFEPETLRQTSLRLVGATITFADYLSATNSAVSSDVVYFDPPYIPLSSSSSFSQYAMADFGLNEQKQLAETISILKSKSVEVILSNSDTELSREIFGNVMNLYQIDASRAIAAKASSRGNVKEIIGTTQKISTELLPPGMTPISFC